MAKFGQNALTHTLAYPEYQGLHLPFTICQQVFSNTFSHWDLPMDLKIGLKDYPHFTNEEKSEDENGEYFSEVCIISKRWTLDWNSALRFNLHIAVHHCVHAMLPNFTEGMCIEVRTVSLM